MLSEKTECLQHILGKNLKTTQAWMGKIHTYSMLVIPCREGKKKVSDEILKRDFSDDFVISFVKRSVANIRKS